jgi:pyruvate/2-oxoglutarate dehydrogenase complex dihydrolipoamide acyltransferase (E2) component
VAPRGSNPRGRENERGLSGPHRDGLAENQDLRHEDPDVVLDVPMLNVEELDLEVEDLRAHVSVHAQLADFVKIDIGVDAYLDKVKLGIKGVEAQVLLKVKLERILGTIERALAAIEQNPGLLDAALKEANRAVGEIEGAAGGSGEPARDAADEPGRAAQPGGGAETAEQKATEVQATDAARRKAGELGVDLSKIEGSGAGGRILVRDVKEAASG